MAVKLQNILLGFQLSYDFTIVGAICGVEFMERDVFFFIQNGVFHRVLNLYEEILSLPPYRPALGIAFY